MLHAFCSYLHCYDRVFVCVHRTNRGGHLSPLQHHVFSDAPVRVHVDAFVLIADQQLDAVRVGKDDDGVRLDAGLNLSG